MPWYDQTSSYETIHWILFCSSIYVVVIGSEYDLSHAVIRTSYAVAALFYYDKCSKGVADLLSSLGMRQASNF